MQDIMYNQTIENIIAIFPINVYWLINTDGQKKIDKTKLLTEHPNWSWLPAAHELPVTKIM